VFDMRFQHREFMRNPTWDSDSVEVVDTCCGHERKWRAGCSDQ
jgi:hypothetical protein